VDPFWSVLPDMQTGKFGAQWWFRSIKPSVAMWVRMSVLVSAVVMFLVA
jgi:hypothetical protein